MLLGWLSIIWYARTARTTISTPGMLINISAGSPSIRVVSRRVGHAGFEIGANSAIDCATLGSTIIGKGKKIQNLVQVGHNCRIDENSILCAQTGLAGSTIIGKTVYIAGQVGVAGHLKIDDGAMIGAQSGVTNNVPKGAKLFGSPAIEAKLQKRIMVSEKYLPEVVKDYRKRQKAKDKK